MPQEDFLMKLSFIIRDLKNPELKLLILTILLSVLCVSSILFFTQGIRAGLEDNTGILLGGDRVLSSPQPIEPEIIQKAKNLGLKYSENVIFYSMLVKNNPDKAARDNQDNNYQSNNNQDSGNNTELALAEIKAVDEYYPLKGELRSSKILYGEDEVQKGIPQSGSVWLEANLFSLLDIEIGDNIYIGYLPLKVTKVLTFEPDRGGDSLTLAPRALINLEDLAKTKVIGPGSRQNYKLLLSGPTKTLETFENWLQPKLTATEKWTDSKSTRPVVKNLLDQAEDYLFLIIVLNVFIAGLAVSQAARRFAWRQYQFVAILKCFGAKFSWIFKHFMLEMFIYSILATAVGYILGAGLFFFSKSYFENLLTQNIAIIWVKPLIMSVIIGLLLTFIFVLPNLLKLQQVSALWIFRQRRGRIESGLVSTFSAWKKRLSHWAGSFGVEFRYGLSNLMRFPFENTIQVLAFSLVMTCAWLLFLVRTDLMNTWQKQVPAQAPNYFAINIFPDRADPFRDLLLKNNIKSEKLYPIIRGRLIAINNELIETAKGEKEGRAQLKRMLNLTYDLHLPLDNEVVEGQWFTEADEGKALVSLEQGFAQRLDIHLNDSLKFQIEGKEWIVKVKSLRKVVWDTFHPNFFVIFPPKVLDEMPFTYITSFYLKPEQRSILREILREFPAVNLIDMSLILKNIANMIQKISFAIEYLWLLTGILAFLLLFCTLIVNLEERKDNAILFRALGVGRKKLFGMLFCEFFILGGISGFIAVIAASIAYIYIGRHIFNLVVKVQPWLLLFGPLIGMFLISTGSYLGLRKVFKVTPSMALSLR